MEQRTGVRKLNCESSGLEASTVPVPDRDFPVGSKEEHAQVFTASLNKHTYRSEKLFYYIIFLAFVSQ